MNEANGYLIAAKCANFKLIPFQIYMRNTSTRDFIYQRTLKTYFLQLTKFVVLQPKHNWFGLKLVKIPAMASGVSIGE